jgi:hypothetical protein
LITFFDPDESEVRDIESCQEEKIRILTKWIVHITISDNLRVSGEDQERIFAHIILEYFG